MMPEEMMGEAPKPRKRHRRGTRGRGHHKGETAQEHEAHLNAARDAARKGDRKSAKGHAFAFVKSLGRDDDEMESPAMEAMETPAMEAKEAYAERPAPKPAGRSAAFAALLARQKAKK